MRLFAKPFLTGVGILVLLIAVALIGLNAWLALPSTRELIQRGISQALGMPVTVGSTRALPLPLPSIRMGDIKAISGSNAFKADSITMKPNLLDLIRGRINASGVTLSHPSLRFTLGSRQGASSLNSGILPPSPLILPPSTQPSSRHGELPSRDTITLPKAASAISLRNIRIIGGNFTYLDAEGHPVLSLKDVTVYGEKKDQAWHGKVSATSAVIGSGLIIRNLDSPFSSFPGESPEGVPFSVGLDSLTAKIGEGTLSGKASLSTDPCSPDYSATLCLEGAKLGSLLADASLGSSSSEGSLSGNLCLAGTAGKGSTMNGTGNLLCKEVAIQPVDFLRQIGQFLNIEELKLLRLSEGKCLFRIDQGRFVIDDLLLRSENLILAANGPMESTGELNLDSRLLFNEKLTAKLRGLLGNKLSPAPEAGYTQVSFRVTGPARKPKTDLLERLTGIKIDGDLGSIGGLLQGLLAPPKPQTTPQPQAQNPAQPVP
jgi:hypothetical protein